MNPKAVGGELWGSCRVAGCAGCIPSDFEIKTFGLGIRSGCRLYSSDFEIKPSDLELIQVTGKAFSFKTINRLALKAPN